MILGIYQDYQILAAIQNHGSLCYRFGLLTPNTHIPHPQPNNSKYTKELLASYSMTVLWCVCRQATAEANNLAAVAAAKDLYIKKMEEVSVILTHLSSY